jgi:hypothetical protein
MKKIAILLTITTLSAPVYAEGWFDSLKNLVGLGETTTATTETPEAESSVSQALPNIGDMVGMVTNSLSVNKDQAEGGLGSIFNYAKENLSIDQFSQLGASLPGVGDLVKGMPDISKLSSGEGLGGLLDKASSYSDSLKSINDVKKQFESLGLKPEMITQFVSAANTYLDTPEGAKAKELLAQGVSKLVQ